MDIQDFSGRFSISNDRELLDRIRSVRTGPYGAFVLSHDEVGPSLWIHINQDLAYLHYFPSARERHPGFQPTGMTPANCPAEAHFLLVGGDEGSAIEMPASTLVTAEVAYRAAVEFLHDPGRPSSVAWFEL